MDTENKFVTYGKYYDELVMNLILVQNEDIEYYDDIKEFIERADYVCPENIAPELEQNRHVQALMKFFEENKDIIGYSKNIFLEKTGTEIYIRLQELYQEILNEED